MDLDGFRSALLAWYDVHRRDLPWRRDTDPYRVLVSEAMLQQTRVDVVVPYFERWVARWPTAEDLAGADDEEVLAAWSGLGYYRRARNLHAAARHVAARGWPTDLTELPGVGTYVAGAVGSIAFGRPVAAVDGNVQRVVARWFGVQDDATRAKGRDAITAHAQDLVDPMRPGDWTQAMIELGALVCRPTAPRCGDCPVAAACTGRSMDPERLPMRPARRPPVPEAVHLAAVVQDGRILLTRRGPGLLAGTWGLPGGDRDTPLEDHVRAQSGWQVRVAEEADEAVHVFSHRKWTMRVHRAEPLDAPDGSVPDGVRWVPFDCLDGLGVSTAMRKAIAATGLPG